MEEHKEEAVQRGNRISPALMGETLATLQRRETWVSYFHCLYEKGNESFDFQKHLCVRDVIEGP